MGIKRRCNHPTCEALINRNNSYCDKHLQYTNKVYNDIRRRNDPEYIRFYKSKQWQNLRRTVMLENDYVCVDCGRQANVVDHIIPTKIDWSKRLDKNNLQPLCHECHNRKTQSDMKRYK